MDHLVQSAIDSANQGDRSKAVELLKQALNANPNDVDALLALASLVNEPMRKRQVLNPVLSVEATNKAAREMLLETDRAEMSAFRSPAAPAPSGMAVSQPVPPASQPGSPPGKSVSVPSEKPLVFRYSTGWLIVLYLFATFFCCIGALVASQSVSSSIPPLMMGFLFGVSALAVSSKVEVTESGIKSSSWQGSDHIKWDEIASIKPNSVKRKLELVSNKGKSVKVSTQVKGYGTIVELLRQKRPDLFDQARPAPVQQDLSTAGVEESPSIGSPSTAAIAFTGIKTFQKSFIKQYGLLFVLIPLCLLFVWLGFADTETRTAFFITATGSALLMLIPFFQVSAVKVEPDKLTIQTFFEEKELSASQIREIKMQSLRGRYGRVTNIVNIIPVEGKNYPLGGFADGEEIMYGYLINWWDRSRNR